MCSTTATTTSNDERLCKASFNTICTMFEHGASAGMHWTPIQPEIRASGPIASTTQPI
jgi:hypothetical protein